MSKYQSDDPCIVCHKRPTDLHHVTTRKAGGKDTPDNLMPLCRKHHTEYHQYGPGKMCRLYPSVKVWLEHHNRADILQKINR